MGTFSFADDQRTEPKPRPAEFPPAGLPHYRCGKHFPQNNAASQPKLIHATRLYDRRVSTLVTKYLLYISAFKIGLNKL